MLGRLRCRDAGGRAEEGVSSPASPHLLFSADGVSKFPSTSVSAVSLRDKEDSPFRRKESVAGGGVVTAAEDCAVVCDVAEGTRKPGRGGVEKSEGNEPRVSSKLLKDCIEESVKALSRASDMVVLRNKIRMNQSLFWISPTRIIQDGRCRLTFNEQSCC